MHTLASCWDNFAGLLSWSLVESPAYNEIGCSTIVQHKLSKPPTCWLVGPNHIRQFFALLCLYVLIKLLLWFYDIVLVPRDNCLKLVGISASTSTDLSANCAADDDPALLLLGDVVWPRECCNHPRTGMNSHRTTVGMYNPSDMFWSFPLPCCFVFMFHTTKITKLLVRRQLGISLLFRTAGDVAVVFFWWKPSSSERASMCWTWSIFSVEVVGPVARVNQVPSHTRLLQRRGIKTGAKEPQKSLWFTDLHADPYYLTNIRNLPWFFAAVVS